MSLALNYLVYYNCNKTYLYEFVVGFNEFICIKHSLSTLPGRQETRNDTYEFFLAKAVQHLILFVEYLNCSQIWTFF